jgi:hypothetical protein
MKLAFRKTNASGFLPTLFNRYTKWSLKTDYPHGGVLIDGVLWHTTPKGLMPEVFNNHNDFDVFDTPVSDKIALNRISEYKGIRYDGIGLIGFKLPWRFSDSNALYCFEVLWLALTGENPSKPISPDTVMAELLRQINAQSNEADGDAIGNDDHNRDLFDPGSGAS